jgi:hypothetical protein
MAAAPLQAASRIMLAEWLAILGKSAAHEYGLVSVTNGVKEDFPGTVDDHQLVPKKAQTHG